MRKRDLWIYVYANGRSIVSIGSEHFPRSSMAIRVDEGAPVIGSSANDGNFSEGTSRNIIEKLKRGSSVTTRYMKWPYRQWEDDSWDLYGFNEAYRYINWAVRRIK